MRAPRDLPRHLQLPFDRVTYRDGQLLASRDLQDDVRANQRLRALHTRALHGTWGIALGFEVTGAMNATALQVGPGYAIDGEGQELALAETLEVPVPDTAAAVMIVLVMTYQHDTQFRPRPEVDAVCLGAGLNPRNERPLLAWRTPEDVRFGADVPLAAAFVHKGALLAPPNLQVRRYAARHIRPHIGSGTIRPTFQASEGAFAVDVDTSEAGFTRAPTYFARLEFDPSSRVGPALMALLPFAFVQAAEPTRFRYVIPIRRGVIGVGFDRFAVARPPQPVILLTWVGFEPVSGCEPRVNPLFVFTLAGLRIDFRLRTAGLATARL